MSKKVIVILLTSILSCFLLYLLERVLLVNYETKTVSKILFFTLIPIVYWNFFRRSSLQSEKKKTFLLSFILSIATFSVIWVGYFIFEPLVNFDSIEAELGLSQTEFLLRGIYIILGNSFLEEFFFRGFIFLNMYELGLKKFAHLFSSSLFAIYHIAIFQSWFPLPIMLLVLLSLFVVGFIFNYLCTRVSSFTGSWVVHASADLAIILIGWYVFYN